jgi:lactate dehydrogenase-like 2-hydroxyacid dehydrogenase
LIGEQKASVIVSGGVGCGVVGEDVAKLATRALRESHGSPKELVRLAQLRLQPAMTPSIVVAEVNARMGIIAIAGVGNVAARLITPSGDDRIYAATPRRSTNETEYAETRHSWPEHSIVVLHSPGLRDDWTLSDAPGILHCDPAVIAGWLVRDQAIDNNDVTVVVLKRG